MQVAIKKSALRELNKARGSLNLDSGQVFVQFIGTLDISDGLYHGEIIYADPGNTAPEKAVSINDILTKGA